MKKLINTQKLNIGIDIDGTITTPYYWLPYFNKLFNKNITEKECIHYDTKLIYGISEEEWNLKNCWNIADYLRYVDIRQDAIEVINILKQKYDCQIITARSNDDFTRKETEKYLNQNGLNDIPLHMLSSHYKLDKAKELNIHIFIEDSPSNALVLAENGIKVYLINTNYNQGVEHDNIVRIDSWYEILEDMEDKE